MSWDQIFAELAEITSARTLQTLALHFGVSFTTNENIAHERNDSKYQSVNLLREMYFAYTNNNDGKNTTHEETLTGFIEKIRLYGSVDPRGLEDVYNNNILNIRNMDKNRNDKKKKEEEKKNEEEENVYCKKEEIQTMIDKAINAIKVSIVHHPQ